MECSVVWPLTNTSKVLGWKYFLHTGLLGLLAIVCLAASPVLAGNVVFPAGSVIRVTDPDFKYDPNVPSTGRSAIQKAIELSLDPNGPYSVWGGTGQYVYLPDGVYEIDMPLEARDKSGVWRHGLTLIGQSREGTIIRLANNTPLFWNPADPKGMIRFASGEDGNGNSGFNNFVLNMTVDAGKGNPGACGIDFIGNNVSGIQNVSIVSQSNPNSNNKRQGVAGILMKRKTSGPGLIKNVSIEGFDYGIYYGLGAVYESAHEVSTMVMEDLTLRSQYVAGIWTYQSMITARHLTSMNSKPAIQVENSNGMIYILDSQLDGGSASISAIQSPRSAFLRNVRTSGYQSALSIGTTVVPGKGQAEYVSSPIASLNASPMKTLDLPVQETPEYWDTDLSHWAAMPAPCGTSCVDDAVPIRNAISALGSSISTIWFPRGSYKINSTINIPGSIKHIVGIGTTMEPGPGLSTSNPLFKIEDASASNLRIEHMIFGMVGISCPNAVCIRHTSSRPITFTQTYFTDASNAATAYQSAPGAGPVFIENVGGTGMAKWNFSKNQKIWARQFNVEGDGYMIRNSGADLWILGLKTEKSGTVIETLDQGRTELFGGCLKATFNKPEAPAFVNTESSVSLGYWDSPGPDTEFCVPGNRNLACSYRIQIREKLQNVQSELLEPTGLTLNGGDHTFGSVVPLYVGYPFENRPALIATKPATLMDRFEVTQEEYARVMAGHPNSAQQPSTFKNRSHPVESITYFDAILYCNYRSELEGFKKVYSYSAANIDVTGKCTGMTGLTQEPKKDGYRLPTEEEWSIGYRAGKTTPNYWESDETSLYAWYSVNTLSCTTKPVGQKWPNPKGIYDMAGNVQEWIWSDPATTGYSMGGYYSSTGNSELTSTSKISSLKSSTNPSTGFRVLRLAPPTFSQIINPFVFQ